MNTRAEERIRTILVNTPTETIAGFCVTNFIITLDEKRKADHSYWVDMLISLLDESNVNMKELFIDTFAEDSLRVCTNCGEFMVEGYYLDGDYACCDECAIELYNGDADAFFNDIENAEEEDCETYWTEWEI